MAKSTTITLSDIKNKAKKHLSIIGRRFNRKDGDKNYQIITLTSNEIDVLDDYINGGAAYLKMLFPEQLADTSAPSQPGLVLIDNRWNENAQGDALAKDFAAYILSYTIGSYLAMFDPNLAAKYQSEAKSYLMGARAIVYAKNEPSTPKTTFSDFTPTVS
jgi:hypothetical protein